MKVIGTNGTESCVVIITKKELAQLAGFYSAYTAEGRGIRMTPGASIAVDKLYNDLYIDATFIVGCYGELRKDLAANQTRLNRLAELLNRKPGDKEASK